MRKLKTSELLPGMILAEDIFTYNNQRILTKGTELTDSLITRLEFYSILSAKVEDETASAKPVEEELSYFEQLRKSKSYVEFKVQFDHSVDSLRQKLDQLAAGSVDVNVTDLLEPTLNLIQSANGSHNIFDMLHTMREYDDSTYAHSLNVSLICYMIARWLRMDDEEIRLATMCGLLHDVGKTKIPDTIIKKPSKLTMDEYLLVKTHPLEGHKLLRAHIQNPHVLNSALMHHERCDGSGYPHGLTANKIDKFAKIVAIADAYEAMTAPRLYRGPMCPFQVVAIFEYEGLQKYEPSYILTFLENMVNTYLRTQVRLSDNSVGEVVFVNTHFLSRPIVKVGDTFHDLSKEDNLSIVSLV